MFLHFKHSSFGALFITLASLSCLASACQQPEPQPSPPQTSASVSQASSTPGSLRQVPLNTSFSLAWEERVQLAETGLTLQWQKLVEDSRCPQNTQCVWAGEVRVALGITQGASQATLALSLPADPENPSQYDKYTFNLEAVSPYPGSSETQRELQLLVSDKMPE